MSLMDHPDDRDGVYVKYREINFRESSLETIRQANRLIAEYRGRDFDLTLRQLYYRMVALGLLPENTKAQYERLGNLLTDGREAGLVSWTSLEDRGRNLMGLGTQKGIGSALKGLRAGYKLDLWEDQPCRVEVWVEKQAMEQVIGQMANQLRVDYFATRGYNSATEMWNAAQRFGRYVERGQRPVVIHLADHDPAGIDMTRDCEERLTRYAGVPVVVRRILLNMDQVRALNPPPNFAKEGDSKTRGYVERFGSDECWEMDALDPQAIHDLIEAEVSRWRDDAKFKAAEDREAADLAELDVMIEENT